MVLVDSYSEANFTDGHDVADCHPSSGGANSAIGQSFKPTAKYKITSCKFYLNDKVGSPTGNAHAVLYAHTGTFGTDGKPTGSPLATSDDFDISQLTGSYALYELFFTGAQQYEMQANTAYCIVFEAPATGTMDLSNYFAVGYDGTTPTHAGNLNYYRWSQWYNHATDACFYVYGTLVGVEYTVTITESLGMLDGVTKILGLKKTVSDLMGMLDSITKQFDARKTVTDKMGILDTIPTKGTFFQTITDKIGMTDTVTRQKSMFQTINDILGLTDTITNKGAFKQAVTDILGMLDTATRHFPLAVTITEILGMRDRLVTKKRRFPLPDLPDHTIRGGAQD